MYLDSDGYTQITAETAAAIVAGNTRDWKFFYENDRNRVTGSITGQLKQFGTSDLINYVTWGLDAVTLSKPWGVTATLQAGGDLTADATYYFRITAFNEYGETIGSTQVSATTDSSNKSIILSWSLLPGAEGYLIYRTTTGDYTNSRRMVIEDGSTLTWTDTGQVSDPSSPYGFPGINTDFDLPTENTTGGEGPDYGTAPETLSADDLDIGILQVGQQVAIWLRVAPPNSTPEYGSTTGQTLNRRNVSLSFLEA